MLLTTVAICSVPSEPLNFANKSRTSSTVNFAWLPPLQTGGVLLAYEVCNGSGWLDNLVVRALDL